MEKSIGMKIDKCGLYISDITPIVAGLPDGINKKTTFEIKCPTTETALNCIAKDGVITERYYAQFKMHKICIVLKLKLANFV